MTVEEAKYILQQLIDFMQFNFYGQADNIIGGLEDIVVLLDDQQEEIDSAWSLLNEMSQSEEMMRQKELLEELEKIFKDKRKIMKVTDA